MVPTGTHLVPFNVKKPLWWWHYCWPLLDTAWFSGQTTICPWIMAKSPQNDMKWIMIRFVQMIQRIKIWFRAFAKWQNDSDSLESHNLWFVHALKQLRKVEPSLVNQPQTDADTGRGEQHGLRHKDCGQPPEQRKSYLLWLIWRYVCECSEQK
jgi:hypothetical protein